MMIIMAKDDEDDEEKRKVKHEDVRSTNERESPRKRRGVKEQGEVEKGERPFGTGRVYY
jgi:hypothetical protein